MFRKLFFIGWCVLTIVLLFPFTLPVAEAANNAAESSTGRPDDWFTKPDDEKKEKSLLRKEMERRQQESAKKSDKKQRYVFLLNDNGYDYYLDTRSARWMNIPYSESEEILDVWIRLEKVGEDEDYSYPKKYFLEHYYLRPKKKQIQFMCELEVTGRPDNAIKEREYSVRNWENIVSGSLEDEIYTGVLKVVKKNNSLWPKHKSVHDVMEDIFRISY